MKYRKKSLGSLFVLLLAFSGMLSFYFFFYQPESLREEKLNAVVLFDGFKKDEVIRLNIRFNDGTNVYKMELENISNVWNILYPVVEEAEENSIFRILDDIPGIKSSKVYRNVHFEKLKEYGLLNPRVYLNIYFKNSNNLAIFVGDKTPTEDFYYMMIGSNSNIVYLVYAYKFLSIEKTPDDFRKKTVFSTQPQAVKKIIIEEGGKKPLIITKITTNNLESYILNSPISKKIDNFKAKAFLINLMSLSISHFYYGKIDNYTLHKFGLNKGGISITLSDEMENDKEKITIGKKAEKNFRYAFHHQRKLLFFIDNTELTNIDFEFLMD